MSTDQHVNQFISKALNTVQYIHFCHLTESSFARHIALGELYEGLPELVDTFAEACLSYPITLTYLQPIAYSDAESSIKQLLDSAHDLHKVLEKLEYFGIINQLEDIITHLQRTMYKLKRLA